VQRFWEEGDDVDTDQLGLKRRKRHRLYTVIK